MHARLLALSINQAVSKARLCHLFLASFSPMASMDPKSVTDCLSAEEGELPITTFSSTERAFRVIRVSNIVIT